MLWNFFSVTFTATNEYRVSVCCLCLHREPHICAFFISSFTGNDNECLSYKTLNENDRAADYFSYHTMKCDVSLPQVWYRFTGRAGTVMPTKCVPKMHCGALSPGWLNGKHPTVGEGVVERMICFTKDDECCFWYSQVLVRNCSAFIVYRFEHFPTAQQFCSLRYCGAGRAGQKF